MSKQMPRLDDTAGTQPKETYVVGYCRPPKQTQFKPGRFGNYRRRERLQPEKESSKKIH
jgi:hypothetical protein